MIFTDVSKWNGIIDWSKQVAQGVEGTYIKASGCGDYGNYSDYKFKENSASCPHKYVGAYHFFDYRKPGADQCKFFLDTVDSRGNLRGMLDIEDNSGSGWARLDGMYGTAMKYAMEFVNQYVLETGTNPGLYLNTGLTRQKDWIGQYIFRNFTHLPLWVANYNPITVPPTGAWSKYSLWQYTSEADGILYGNAIGNKYIDLNRVNDLYSLITKQVPEPIDMTNVLNIPSLSQVDASRGDIVFGTTKIRYDGCVIVNIEMMAKYLGLDIDTARLVDWLKANGGLYGNLFVWKSIEKLLPGLTFTAKYAGGALDKIDESLSRKMPCLVHVDFNPATSVIDQHWVLVIGKSGSSYIINDPKDGKLVRFEDRYGDPLTNIYNVSTYNFTSPIVTDAQKLERLWQHHPELH